jgi:two-component system sensor histidine kinase KdpD
MRDNVISMVSHELRTPLMHIKGFVSSLLESDIEWDEETKLDFLRTIDREADRLTAMVSDLSKISRLGSSDFPLHLERVDPLRLAYAAVDEASPFLRRHRAIVKAPEGLPLVEVDALRVMGVLVNLIENATKYSPEGSEIVLDATERPSGLVFSVRDHGRGVAANIKDRIFEMFFRAEPGGPGPKGSGLGLAVCKAVVSAHGGEIWVESDGSDGSTFYFSIPFSGDRPKAAGRKDQTGHTGGEAANVKVAAKGG